MLLVLRKRLYTGDKAEQTMPHTMAIKYTEKQQGGVKGSLGHHGGYQRSQKVWAWHPDEIQ